MYLDYCLYNRLCENPAQIFIKIFRINFGVIHLTSTYLFSLNNTDNPFSSQLKGNAVILYVAGIVHLDAFWLAASSDQ